MKNKGSGLIEIILVILCILAIVLVLINAGR